MKLQRFLNLILLTCLCLIGNDFYVNGQGISICNAKGNFDKENKNCQCIDGFISYLNKTNEEGCNYQLKSYNVALFLSLFGGFVGADMIYLGFMFKAVIKAFLPIGLFFVILYFYDKEPLKINRHREHYVVFPIVLGFVFWFWDVFFVLFGVIKDVNGFQLY